MDSKKILIVDDEPDIVELLSYNLKKENHQVCTASNGNEALKVAIKEKPDLILLDVMMPEKDGIQTCVELRKLENFRNTLIVFLSARSEEFTQLAAFDAGASDYVTKPIKPKLLIQKLNALFGLVNHEEKPSDEIKIGNLVINNAQYLVYQNDEKFVLPRKEFELLSFLVSEPNRVFKREEILTQVWGEDVVVGGRTIDVHIRKLRERLKLENIVTVKGVGYKFQDSE